MVAIQEKGFYLPMSFKTKLTSALWTMEAVIMSVWLALMAEGKHVHADKDTPWHKISIHV